AISTTIRLTNGPGNPRPGPFTAIAWSRWTTCWDSSSISCNRLASWKTRSSSSTSDNGPECEIPPHARAPFRGCKGSSWEGGVRVPTFAYWKGMIKSRRSDGLFDFADILPTALSLAGVPRAKLADLYPKATYIDGVDQASFLVADDGLSARRS